MNAVTHAPRHVLIFGATSAIAQAAARGLAGEGAAFYLVARDTAKLAATAQDLLARGAFSVECEIADLGDLAAVAALMPPLLAKVAKAGKLDIALLAHGILGDQAAAQMDTAVALASFQLNFLSCVAILTPLANHLEQQRSGSIAIISSVAGDRGRQSNYVYGSAKAALSAFASGLRQRLAPAGVQVLTVKPGFVATPMTAHLAQGPLFASAEQVGRGLQRALERGADVVYLPRFWQLIMTVIKLIPEPVFKRLRL